MKHLPKAVFASFFLLFLSGVFSFSVYAAYAHIGASYSNAFSLAAVLEFDVELCAEIIPGNGTVTKIQWYEEMQGAWVKKGMEQSVSGGAKAGEEGRTVLTVPVSFYKNHRRFRCELRNEAGIVLSEIFELSMKEDGTGVKLETRTYTEDLSGKN